MKRDFLTSLLPEAEKEIIDKIMAENGADVEKAKNHFRRSGFLLRKSHQTVHFQGKNH